MIKPTVGRVVLVFGISRDGTNEPVPALVCKVWGDRMINVGGFNEAGSPFSLTSLQLVQGDDADAPIMPIHAEWMPYQKLAAEKAA